jgi:hypothetical protein
MTIILFLLLIGWILINNDLYDYQSDEDSKYEDRMVKHINKMRKI